MNSENGYSNYLEMLKEIKGIPSLSEADTRCKIIDRILKNVLFWEEKNITREDHVNEGYTDYQLKINDIPFIVLEAKKTGAYFEIPKDKNRRKYKTSGIISSIENLNAAIKQVKEYCINIGTRFGIISNGYQFVVFSTFSPGKKWEDSECIIFNSFNDIKDNFTLFWNIFAYNSVLSGSLVEYLDKSKRKIEFSKLLSFIHNPDQQWARNRLYTFLQPIADFVFSELLDEAKSKVLKECYVYDRSNRNLGNELDDLFIDKLPYFASNLKIKDIYEREAKAGVFQKEYQLLEKSSKEIPLVVLLGGIGSGKSTFIHRFFKIVLQDKESLLWFYLDFRTSSFDEGKIEDFFYSSIIEQFNDVYKTKINEILIEVGFNFDQSNKIEFVKRLFSLLKRMKFSITVIIDNVDQHEYAFQEKLFIFSHHVCKLLKVITIISLREETYLLSMKTGVFDAYHIPKYHISSPNFLSLIKARIGFAIALLNDKTYIKSVNIDTEMNKDMIHFFNILMRSLEKDNNQSRKIIQFFDSISVGNMREALIMFNNFLVSGNTNIDEMFQKEKEDYDTFQIGFHQMLKSIILGEYRLYCSERSQIINLFDFDYSISDSHFNQLRILQYLNIKANSRSPIGRGYLEIEKLYSISEDVSIRRNIIEDCLRRLSHYNLISYDNQSQVYLEGASYVRITPAGNLYLTNILTQFIYLDNMLVDTPISDHSVFREIKKHLFSTDLKERIYKTKLFITYLDSSEQQEFKENPQFLQNEFTNTFFMKKIITEFNTFLGDVKIRSRIDNIDYYKA
ncbi:MAG: hypothetical protein JXA99_02620 [Candidatus Lokiarchaeota archaeon]|nr:hypothetical protein [Candidatus Lokiarchaeota archaeon]